MHHSRAFRLFAPCLLAGVALACFLTLSGPAELPAKTASERSLYHADPEHLWNRLHKALFVRVGPDGRTYGRDRLEPLLWLGSKHLLEEKSHQRAVALLEEFLKNNGGKLVEDPLKQAVLQRDLWLVFNWLEGEHSKHFYEPELKPEEVRAARDRLRRPLAAVIRRLALAPGQIKNLPDNYAAAVASGAFPNKFDPEHPDKPYLPADLFAPDGPWVCVGRPDGPVAPAHLRDTGANKFTNSAFLVFLRLPDGRAAGVPSALMGPGTTAFQDVWQAIVRRKWRILATIVLAVAVGCGYCLYAGPWYTSTAQLLVIKKRLETTPISGPDQPHVVQDDYLSTHMLIIASRRVIA